MKEIDFLPEWYKSDKRRNASYRIQCMILGGVFVIMMVWNFFAAASVSRAEADLTRIVEGNAGVQDGARRFGELKDQIGELQKKVVIIGRTDSRIDVASVLAELSFLIKRPAVLSRVDIIAEKFSVSASGKGGKRVGGLVRAVRAKADREASLPLGDVKFKVVISGVAPEPGNVAALICELEDSAYFFQVVPLFSRNTQIATKVGPVGRSSDVEGGRRKSGANTEASEFEISCYLANYRQEAAGSL